MNKKKWSMQVELHGFVHIFHSGIYKACNEAPSYTG